MRLYWPFSLASSTRPFSLAKRARPVMSKLAGIFTLTVSMTSPVWLYCWLLKYKTICIFVNKNICKCEKLGIVKFRVGRGADSNLAIFVVFCEGVILRRGKFGEVYLFNS